VAFGQAPERHQAGFTRLERQSDLRQALDQHLLQAGRVRLMLDTHDELLDIANQVGVALQPWLHHPLEPQIQHVVQGEVAQNDADIPSLRAPFVAGLDDAIFQHTGFQPPPDQAHEAWVSDSVWHKAPEPAMI
jgi:hypothetical protein